MLEIDRLVAVASGNGFSKKWVSGDGTAFWLQKIKVEGVSNQMSICIDTITQSATIFCHRGTAEFLSKTFRRSSDLEQWLARGTG